MGTNDQAASTDSTVTAERSPGATKTGVTTEIGDNFVATIRLCYPPNNFFDIPRLLALAEAFEAIDANHDARAIVLCSQGKHFCAGANFAASGGDFAGVTSSDGTPAAGAPVDLHIYDLAVRLFACKTPVVAAVQGAAVGGGLGVACMADFRVAGPGSRFAANFARLGIHQGFGLSVTLPAIVGQQAAMEMLYTGRRITGADAAQIGLVDRLVDDDTEIEAEAHAFAAEIAGSAPLAVRSIRQTMRGHLPEAIRTACDRERTEQELLAETSDWREGVIAMGERRAPNFTGS